MHIGQDPLVLAIISVFEPYYQWRPKDFQIWKEIKRNKKTIVPQIEGMWASQPWKEAQEPAMSLLSWAFPIDTRKEKTSWKYIIYGVVQPTEAMIQPHPGLREAKGNEENLTWIFWWTMCVLMGSSHFWRFKSGPKITGDTFRGSDIGASWNNEKLRGGFLLHHNLASICLCFVAVLFAYCVRSFLLN